MDINIYYLLGGLALVYIIFSVYNKKTSKRRKSRKFMEGYHRRDKQSEEKKD